MADTEKTMHVARFNFQASLDALVAAVRADERARCERAIIALGGRHDALNEDEAQGYEIAITRALEAIRNAE